MDGEAIMQAFTTCSGPDCLKGIIPTYDKRHAQVLIALKKLYLLMVNDLKYILQ